MVMPWATITATSPRPLATASMVLFKGRPLLIQCRFDGRCIFSPSSTSNGPVLEHRSLPVATSLVWVRGKRGSTLFLYPIGVICKSLTRLGSANHNDPAVAVAVAVRRGRADWFLAEALWWQNY